MITIRLPFLTWPHLLQVLFLVSAFDSLAHWPNLRLDLWVWTACFTCLGYSCGRGDFDVKASRAITYPLACVIVLWQYVRRRLVTSSIK